MASYWLSDDSLSLAGLLPGRRKTFLLLGFFKQCGLTRSISFPLGLQLTMGGRPWELSLLASQLSFGEVSLYIFSAHQPNLQYFIV